MRYAEGERRYEQGDHIRRNQGLGLPLEASCFVLVSVSASGHPSSFLIQILYSPHPGHPIHVLI